MEPDLAFIVLSLVILTLLLAWHVAFELPRREQARLNQMLEAFNTAIQLRFPSQQGLSERAVSVARHLADELGLSPRQFRRIEAAVYLRDIGLCAIPFGLINHKPMMMWCETDRATYAHHPEVSAAMLDLIPSFAEHAELIRAQTRDFDVETPMEARVLRVAHDFALAEPRLGGTAAVERLVMGSGTSYDPEVVRAFLGSIESTSIPPAIPVQA